MTDIADGPMPEGPLRDIRVLDLSRVFAGPWCGQMLADLGADVVKVEHPRGGDDSRHMGAALLGADGRDTGDKASFLAMNRGKRSIAIDLAVPAGQELVRALAGESDVVIENFRTGALARYGLDAERLRDADPRLIYCSITGFGQTGPDRERPGYDAIFQARSGVMSVTGDPDGGPCLIGYSASDINAGLYAAIAVLAALRHRDRTGEGQHIDLALLDAQIASMSHLVLNHLLSGRTPVRAGSGSQINAPWKAFACRDGALMITVGNDRQFRALLAVLRLDALQADARFGTNADRLRHREALMAALDPTIASWPVKPLADALDEAGVPAAEVLDLPAALADPQIVARGLVRRLAHPLAGEQPSVANPIRFSGMASQSDRPPPSLNGDRDAVLRERLGLGPAEIGRLVAAGALRN